VPKIANLLPWRRRRLEQDLDRELRYHVDRRIGDLTRSGLTDEEARRQAAIELGGVTQIQEQVRETWIWRWLDNGGRDLRYAVRALLRNPGFAAAAVLSLALGIGANAAVFSLVDQALLRPLPVTDPDRLVHLDWKGYSHSSVWGTGNLMSYPLCRDLQQQTAVFAGVFCRHPTEVNVSTGKQHDPVPAEIVSGSYFPVLDVRPQLGRLIDQSDDRQPGAHPVVVLSHGYWRDRFGGADDVVGRSILVNNFAMTIIGVAPASFRGVDPLQIPSLWIPAMMKRQATPEWDRLLDRRAAWMHVFARLEPGVTVDDARAGLQPWFRSMLGEDAASEGLAKATADQLRLFLASTIDVLPGAYGLSAMRSALERPLLVLMVGTSLLALLACLNVAGLLLARGAARAREVATRIALGASRRRITSQWLVEGLLIALAGGLLGLVLAPAVIQVLLLFVPGNADLTPRMDHRVFLVALAVSVLTGVVCGLAPAWQAGRRSLAASTSERSPVAAHDAVRLRKTIVIVQLAFTLVLLMGAGLFVQTLARLHARDRGYDSGRLLMYRVEPDAIGYSASDAPQFMRDLLDRLRNVPVVEGVAVANSSLLTGGSPRRQLTIQSDRRIVTERPLPIMRVGERFFSTLGIPVIDGRDFTESDTRDVETAGYRAVIVNENFARRYFAGRSPVGHRVGVGTQPNIPASIEIVGMVKDFSFRFLRDDAEPEHVFFPFAQTGPLAGNGTFYIKVRDEPASASAPVRAAVAAFDPRLSLVSLRSVDDQIGRVLRPERALAALTSGFGAVALLIAVVGLYGVMSFVVTRRTREIGIRLALGATRANAVWLIIRDAMIMIGAGAAIALPTAWALRYLVEAQLFGVRAFDGPTLAMASGLLAIVAVAAAMLPAWRAASASPTDALRAE
jgi:predicted permease